MPRSGTVLHYSSTNKTNCVRISVLHVNSTVCVGHLGIEYGGHHSEWVIWDSLTLKMGGLATNRMYLPVLVLEL